MYTAETWPIACNMLSFGSTLRDGTPMKDAPAEVWDDAMKQVVDLGFTALKKRRDRGARRIGVPLSVK